jgi:hypothetical protein
MQVIYASAVMAGVTLGQLFAGILKLTRGNLMAQGGGMWLFFGVWIGFLAGVALGAWVKNEQWSNNANKPMRMCYRGKFYKTVLLDDPKSTMYFEVNNLV